MVKGSYDKKVKKSYFDELKVIVLTLAEESQIIVYFGHNKPRDLTSGVPSTKITIKPQ